MFRPPRNHQNRANGPCRNPRSRCPARQSHPRTPGAPSCTPPPDCQAPESDKERSVGLVISRRLQMASRVRHSSSGQMHVDFEIALRTPNRGKNGGPRSGTRRSSAPIPGGSGASRRGRLPFRLYREGSGKLYRARSRLYRGQILQVSMRLKALAEIYTMHSFAQLLHNFWNPYSKTALQSQFFVKFHFQLPKILRNFKFNKNNFKIVIFSNIFNLALFDKKLTLQRCAKECIV